MSMPAFAGDAAYRPPAEGKWTARNPDGPWGDTATRNAIRSLVSEDPLWPAAEPASAGPQPDRRGRRRDTYHFFAYQVVAIGVLYAMPEDLTGWTIEQKESYSVGEWWDNVRAPQRDSDDFYLNYLLHPYWGAAYYVRSRDRGYGRHASFWYAAALSASYEFGAEALFEQPSIQDLVVTPLGGWLLGEYFVSLRKHLAASGKPGTSRRLLMVLTDPLGSINRTVDGWLGIEPATLYLQVDRADMTIVADHAPASAAQDVEPVYGLSVVFRW